MEHEHVPGVEKRRQLLESTHKINQLRVEQPGLVVLPAHDPGAAGQLAAAATSAV